MATHDLTSVLGKLYASEINAGLASFWDAGFTAWLGDDMNGHKAEHTFSLSELDAVAPWLHEQALRLYPGSAYAKAEAPHFDITDDGRMVALPTWERNNEVTSNRLLMVSIEVSPEVIAQWSDDQVRDTDVWTCSVHLHASDNDDIKVPPKPAHLPEPTPWQPSVPGTII